MNTTEKGFTLLELMVVVGIVGILSSIAIPSYTEVREQARVASAAQELQAIAKAFMAYEAVYSEYPDDSHRTLPDGMEEFLDQSLWDSETPLGGFYNWEGPDQYDYAGVSIFNHSVDNDLIIALDRKLDDGNPDSGRFRIESNGRPTLIIFE